MEKKLKNSVESTQELAVVGTKLDVAAETDMYFGAKSAPQDAEGWKGVYNISTGKFISPVTKMYQIIQHHDAFKAVADTLSRLNIGVQGTVVDRDNTVKADLVFTKNGAVVKDDATGIMTGIRVINSYNRRTSFRLEMFAYRMVCKNGMTFGKTMGIVESQVHSGTSAQTIDMIEKMVELFVKRVVNSNEKLQAYVNEMMVDSVEWEIAEKLLKRLVKSKKHMKEILTRIPYEGKVTRWDLYNALTNYATHDQHLKPCAEYMVEKASQKLMVTSFDSLDMTMEAEIEVETE